MCACAGLQTQHFTLQLSPETWTRFIQSFPSASKETFSIRTPTSPNPGTRVRTTEQTFSLYSVPPAQHILTPMTQLGFDAAFLRKTPVRMRVLVTPSPPSFSSAEAGRREQVWHSRHIKQAWILTLTFHSGLPDSQKSPFISFFSPVEQGFMTLSRETKQKT